MKNFLKNFLSMIVIVVICLGLSQLFGGGNITLNFGEDQLTLTAPQDFSMAIEYDQIKNLELIEMPDTGTVLSGDESRRYSWGERENDTWGTYTLCIFKKIDVAILVTTLDGEKMVFNYEKDETTESILDLLTQAWEQQKAA